MITHTTKQGHIDPNSMVAFRADLWLLLGKAFDVHLFYACARGHLPAVHVLAEQYPLDARAENNAALCWASINGHLFVVAYLTEHFQLTQEDARANDNFALRVACHAGHLPVVRYLSEHYQLTREDARADYNHALRAASEYGHLPVVRYLVEHYGLTAEDIQAARRGASGT